MTTTAYDDQFAATPEPLHQPYDTSVSMSQNYASFAHVAHKGATHCDDCGLTWLDDGLNPLGCPYCKDTVPALAVPEEWLDFVRRVVTEVLAILPIKPAPCCNPPRCAMINDAQLKSIEAEHHAHEDAENEWIVRNTRRYLALRERGVMLSPPDGGIYHNEILDAAADRLLENES